MSRVAVLGLGTMGAPIAGHLAAAGHSVQAWNRGTHRTAPAGTTQHTSLADALSGADAVVLSVSDTPDVQALILGAPDQLGAIDILKSGAVVIDTST
ncbi:MAG: NAD(P)-binding domain-containing protein, partial [Candidatus Limnocylindrus sp.]